MKLKVDTSILTGPITEQAHVAANKILFEGVPGGPMSRIGTVAGKSKSVCMARADGSMGDVDAVGVSG